MTKIRTNVSINKKVWKKARELEINISNFLEIKLREYIALIEGNRNNNTTKYIDNDSLNLIRKEVDSLSRRNKSN